MNVAAAAQPTSAELTLADALSLTLADNPELKAEALEVRAAEARRADAASFPNPELAIELEDFLGSGALAGFAGAQTTLQVSQLIELGGKRSGRQGVADGAHDLAETSYAARRVALLTETTARFIHVVADQHRLLIARDARALAEALLAAAKARVGGGGASPVEEKRATIAAARGRIEQEHAEHELLASRRRLAAMWNESEPRFSEARADLFARRPLPSFETLAARIDANPELVRVAKGRATRDAELAAAEAQAYPDLRITLGARRLEGLDAFGVVLGVAAPLPLFQHNQGAIDAAQAKRAQVDAEHDAARVRLLASLYGQYQEVVHAMSELDTLDAEVLPSARSMVDLLAAGFATGRFSQLELLDAQRTLIEVRRERVTAAEELNTFAVRLEGLLGAPGAPAGNEGSEKSTTGNTAPGHGGHGE